MSEAIAGLPPPPPPSTPRDATVVIPIRTGAHGRQVFWVHRGRSVSFFAGFRAFPGGRLDAADQGLALPGFSGEDAALRVGALRELFEETGLLLVEGTAPDAEALRSWRGRLLDGTGTFAEMLDALGAKLDAARLRPAGRWVTPAYLPSRFDARFFLLELREGETAEVWPGELASGEWVRPADALARWAQGETLLHPPNLNALLALNEAADLESLLHRLREPPHVHDFVTDRVEFQQGIRLFPLRTPTLPPASHTNCYLVGNGELLLIDPGASDADEQTRLAQHLRQLQAEGLRPKAVFLTHHHGDHTGALEMLRSEFNLPVWCHAETAQRVGKADRLVVDGEHLMLAGEPDLELVALHTPGHAPGHLCLFHPASRALLCGDMVANGSTIIVDPPEGKMRAYLASLERLKALPTGTLYPAHGAPLADGIAKLDEYLAHRRLRIEAIAAALTADRELAAGEVVAQVYTDVPEAIWPIAERSALASLEYLVEEGRAVQVGGRFRRA